MNKNILLSTVLCGLCLAPFAAIANDKIATSYNAQKYQQVCKGKTQGAQVSYSTRGVLFNGTCEPRFFPAGNPSSIIGDEPELYTACTSTSGTATATINGTQMSGKCALGFTPPHPPVSQMMQNQTQMQNQRMQQQNNTQPMQQGSQTQPGM
ncbi:hypothetical protein AY605_07100 [Acinetobacter sp. SFD]|uniref:hypothetical protein n=1 Tax=Acinetobacter sp. SFD TaxID=1805635 RepID=UPI0007D076E1|nr:hypothetical protein [Acinetobacter sp. SFD]OAL84425.1 hypothetical protein AY605_07100 [Acinetobacter sp. SFD]